VEKGWEIVQSVMDVWHALPARDFPNYAAGTWGPKAAEDLLKNDGPAGAAHCHPLKANPGAMRRPCA
jgi:glucose-6-phosphate 1-dehydrogenase